MRTVDMTAAKNIVHDVASQAYNLAMGLQNAAPPDISKRSASIQYLLEMAQRLDKLSHEIDNLSSDETR